MTDESSPTPTIYFGYGSNLWLHQMSIRCPDARYLGIARLNVYKWIINDRGYANVVEMNNDRAKIANSVENEGKETKTENEKEKTQNITNVKPEWDDIVFGLVYELSAEDEKKLDKNEGVPVAYTKELLPTDFWADTKFGPREPESEHDRIDTITMKPEQDKKMLVYIDRKRVTESEPKEEYVYRMNRGIEDALGVGVPKGYVDGVMRRFVRGDAWVRGEGKGEKDGATRELEEWAKRQARGFKDESGVF